MIALYQKKGKQKENCSFILATWNRKSWTWIDLSRISCFLHGCSWVSLLSTRRLLEGPFVWGWILRLIACIEVVVKISRGDLAERSRCDRANNLFYSSPKSLPSLFSPRMEVWNASAKASVYDKHLLVSIVTALAEYSSYLLCIYSTTGIVSVIGFGLCKLSVNHLSLQPSMPSLLSLTCRSPEEALVLD